MQMKTEKEKMLSGELYDASESTLVAGRYRARKLCKELNDIPPDNHSRQTQIVRDLFGKVGDDVYLTPPFFCDYGSNIELGANVYFNFNCIVLDPARVTIGSNTMFGPAVQIYTATHPLNAVQRRTGLELAFPIHIGSDVWIGGNAVICPGVTIGDRAVIGAGSVVTRNIPSDVFAAGNPCKVIRQITDQGT